MLVLSESITYKYESLEEMEQHQEKMKIQHWAVNDSYKSYDGMTVIEYVKEWE